MMKASERPNFDGSVWAFDFYELYFTLVSMKQISYSHIILHYEFCRFRYPCFSGPRHRLNKHITMEFVYRFMGRALATYDLMESFRLLLIWRYLEKHFQPQVTMLGCIVVVGEASCSNIGFLVLGLRETIQYMFVACIN